MPETRSKKASKKGPTTKQLKLEETGCQKNTDSKIVNSEENIGSISKEQSDSSDTKIACNRQKHKDHPERTG